MFKKYLVVFLSLFAVLALIGNASAKVKNNKKDVSEVHKRVVSYSKNEVSNAFDLGCKFLKETKTKVKTVQVLDCPESAVESLSLIEDVQVFAMRENGGESNRSQVGSASLSANTQIGATIVHNNGNTGVGRKIAVLDTGYNYLHPELSSSYFGGKDFVNNDDDPMDDNGHGSHVSGIITGDGVDSNAKGVAPGALIVAGKVLDQNGSGFFSDIIAGIYWAVDGPDGVYGNEDDFKIDAINMSLGTGAPYLYRGFCDGVFPDLTEAVKYAVSKGVAVVSAAGNSGSAGISLPGCISFSTTVGAVDSKDRIASFSGRGLSLDIVSPGVSIYSSILGSSYASWSGTSMATPMISGVVALIKSAHPSFSQVEVESRIFSTAKDLGKSGKDKDYGWGRVRADLAVN